MVRNSCAKIRSLWRAKRSAASVPPHRRSAGRREGGCGFGGQRRIDAHISSVVSTAMPNTQSLPT